MAPALDLELGSLLEAFVRPAAMAVVAAIVIVLVRLLVEGEGRPGFRQALRGIRGGFWRVVGGQMLFTLGMLVLVLTIVGIPFAVNKYVAWSFVKQEILFEDKRIRGAFHGSADLVRGRWWHTVRFVLFLFLVTQVTGPVLTFALIFTALPLFWVNLLGALVFALLIPYVALGETLLYLDLAVRAGSRRDQAGALLAAVAAAPVRPRQAARRRARRRPRLSRRTAASARTQTRPRRSSGRAKKATTPSPAASSSTTSASSAASTKSISSARRARAAGETSRGGQLTVRSLPRPRSAGRRRRNRVRRGSDSVPASGTFPAAGSRVRPRRDGGR